VIPRLTRTVAALVRTHIRVEVVDGLMMMMMMMIVAVAVIIVNVEEPKSG
jgi:hypothetical protein